MKSVLQDWVMELPLREQGVLLTGIRGCDLSPKNASLPEKQIVAYLRWCVLNPADPREVDIEGAFFRSRPPDLIKMSALEQYPLHWVIHLMHCFEVVGYRHPEFGPRAIAIGFYHKFVHGLHLYPESKEQMIARLGEDRIAHGNVVN